VVEIDPASGTAGPGLEILLYRLEDEGRRLVERPAGALGAAHRPPRSLEPEAYIVRLRRPGLRDVRVPVLIRAGRPETLRAVARGSGRHHRREILIPGGPALLGGAGARETRRASCDPFPSILSSSASAR